MARPPVTTRGNRTRLKSTGNPGADETDRGFSKISQVSSSLMRDDSPGQWLEFGDPAWEYGTRPLRRVDRLPNFDGNCLYAIG